MESFKLIDLERGIAWYASKEVVFIQISLRGMVFFIDYCFYRYCMYACFNSVGFFFNLLGGGGDL